MRSLIACAIGSTAADGESPILLTKESPCTAITSEDYPALYPEDSEKEVLFSSKVCSSFLVLFTEVFDVKSSDDACDEGAVTIWEGKEEGEEMTKVAKFCNARPPAGATFFTNTHGTANAIRFTSREEQGEGVAMMVCIACSPCEDEPSCKEKYLGEFKTIQMLNLSQCSISRGREGSCCWRCYIPWLH